MATTAKQQSSTSSSSSTSNRNSKSSSGTTVTSAGTITGTSLASSSIRPSQSSHHHQQPGQKHSCSGFDGEHEDDIEIIAKQISDHAEAIYQTWKARGLAPTEILNCHSVNSDAFDKTLTPFERHTELSITNEIRNTDSVNMSNNNLKKLVSSFVSEDKARQQTVARKTNILTSGTIKDALRKFENTTDCNTNIKPNYLKYNTNNSTAIKSNASLVAQSHREQSPKLQQSPSNNYENKLNKNVPDVLINTIEQEKLVQSSQSVLEEKPIIVTINKTKPETPAKPASLLNHTPAWPLKTRSKIENGTVKGAAKVEKKLSLSASEAGATTTTARNVNVSKSPSKKLDIKCKSNDLMDEVLMEEERLINALKTGTVLNNDKILPEVITSTLNTTNNSTKTDSRNWSKSQTNNNSNNKSNQNNNNINNNNSSQTISKTNAWNDDVKPVTVPATSTAISETSEMDGVQLKLSSKPRPKNDAAVPHPDVSLHTNKTSNSTNARSTGTGVPAVRPFLTRGSVAERVLMFEKCPEIKALRNAPKESSKLTTKPIAKPEQTCTTLQRHIRGSKNVYIPRFHFPHGKPLSSIALETTLQRLQAAFDAFPNNSIPKENFLSILKICAMPFYWRMPLFHCTQLTTGGLVDGKRFCDFWKQMSVFCHDTVSRFVFILSRGQRSRPYILPEDLVGLVQDVVDTHPGLAFLKEAAEFHSRYVHTVIARIFYAVNRSWSGKITIPELRRSDLLQVLQLLEEEEDINQIMAYFSYEHFYVIYCKFWELDRDHDLFIDQNDLARHNDHALSTRIIERIFSGCVTKTNKANIQKMSYTEFVWFLLSEEDKSHSTAVEYWFRCMDLDGDGILSMYELEYFYEEQQHRMESIGIETLPFEDCLCQMLDMIKPIIPGCITLRDLKRCKMTPIFFDTFFNLEKYMEHEQRDPFATQRDQEEMTDWDRYAAQEYELLVAEEGGDTHGSYDEEEDYESSIDILESHTDDQITCGINDL